MGNIQVIPYSGGKAVKVTETMRKDLDTYNQRKQEILEINEEIKNQKTVLDEKNTEIENLKVTAASDDKKAAKEANKQIKALEKEVDKMNSNVKTLEEKVSKLQAKQDKGKVEGVEMKSFAPKEEINDDFAAELDDDLATELDTDITSDFDNDLAAELNNDFPQNSEEPEVNEIETPEEQNNDELENTTIIAPIGEEAMQEPVIAEDNNEPSEYTLEDEFTPIYDEEETDDDFVKADGPALSEDDVNEIWEGLKNVELQDDNPDVVNNEEAISPDVIPDYSQDNVLPVYENEEQKEAEPIDEEQIKKDVHAEIESSIPMVDVINPVDSETEMNNVYTEVGVEPEEKEEAEERDLNNLTLFRDYEDYTFAFGQQHYGKEALTPDELDALESVKGFLSEKSFGTKRTTQYNKITNENAKLKQKVVDLGKEFKKNIESISSEYTANVEKLTETTEKAKEQAEADRVEKVQTQKLNDSLTDTIKEQTTNIEELTNTNADLQATIDEQTAKIAELEKENQEQDDKIKKFEEKLNTVFGIVKEINKED